MKTTLGELLAEGRTRLALASFRPPVREAALLLARVLGISEAQVLAREEREVEPEAAARFRDLLARRVAGEPVAYLFGEREFWGRTFRVDRRVLIPRPETEHLVEAALAASLPARPRIVDVGTGSGCIAVTLALEIPGARVLATDVSPGALAVAAGNARRHGARVALLGLDLLGGLDLARVDLMVSNPPYVDRGEAAEMSIEVCNFEPHLALFPPDGTGDSTLARLLREASGLRSGTLLMTEIGRGQVAAAERHAGAAGFRLAAARDDYAGIPRVLVFERR